MLRRLMTALSMAACLALTAFAVRAQDMPRGSARVEALLARMTIDEKIGQLDPDAGRAAARRSNSRIDDEERARIRAGGGSAPISTSPAPRRRAQLQRIAVEEIAAAHSAAVRHGRDPRLPHHLPGAAGDGGELGPGGARARRAHRRRPRPPRRACTGPSRRWSTSPAIRAGAGSSKARARIPISARSWPRRRCAATRARASTGPTRSWPPPSISPPMARAMGGRDYAGADISRAQPRGSLSAAFLRGGARGRGIVHGGVQRRSAACPRTPIAALLRDTLRDALALAGACWSATGTRSRSCATTASPESDADAAELALRAGVDMDMSSRRLCRRSPAARRARSRADAAARRGGARSADGQGTARPVRPSLCAQRRRPRAAVSCCPRPTAPRRARSRARSIVLLKNDGNLLPIAASARRIAVIGALADDANSRARLVARARRCRGRAPAASGAARGAAAGRDQRHRRRHLGGRGRRGAPRPTSSCSSSARIST